MTHIGAPFVATQLIPPRQRVHKYVQVRDYVRTLIEALPPGSPAPSERELVIRFGVARMTVRHALDALASEGLLERIPGRGTVVAQPRSIQGWPTSFTEHMLRRGLAPASHTLIARVERAGPRVARALDLSPGSSVLHWKRLRRADQELVCVADTYLNDVLLPGFVQHRTPASLYAALESRGLRPARAEDFIAAEPASADTATLLEIAAGDPVLRHSRRAILEDRIIEVSRTIYRHDRFTFHVELQH